MATKITMDSKVSTPYHRGATGYFFRGYEIRQAFEITTGKNSYEATEEYKTFFDGLIASGSIQEESHPTFRNLLHAGMRIHAIQEYREVMGGSLVEARTVIDEWERQLKEADGQ